MQICYMERVGRVGLRLAEEDISSVAKTDFLDVDRCFEELADISGQSACVIGLVRTIPRRTRALPIPNTVPPLPKC